MILSTISDDCLDKILAKIGPEHWGNILCTSHGLSEVLNRILQRRVHRIMLRARTVMVVKDCIAAECMLQYYVRTSRMTKDKLRRQQAIVRDFIYKGVLYGRTPRSRYLG